ncbi:L-rhamnose mutarotase [Gilvimarinus sp. SDUM040013]|uniref:L-rhamnose mutarotase n=1 Tax=Gilvimarinus gilvus TaxID=3058038 RepID=A0ABU4RXP6_9GAMM|nr:L-rhamnose mutarotase [Gilvimarinus sp. SDUM040013]MDO3386674.1 L-rhamnose mutarotase [Gilvimarinus sp. SDUM040013]MDX6849439.1 L-rhamnose mutarotase [Gilvimarinus sp. SDUM040013]
MEKIALVMQLKPGFEREYEKRHDEIWPELERELRSAGVSDYSIFLHPQTLQLFAVLKREDNHTMDALPQTEIVQKWWRYMSDIMETQADNSPVTIPLNKVFHLE